MKELSLHLLDLIQNAIEAEATKVHVQIKISKSDDLITIIVIDNGNGMESHFL